jgi:hypothetical protein
LSFVRAVWQIITGVALGHPMMMICIVLVQLADDRDFSRFDLRSPFLVVADDRKRCGIYYDEPNVLAQFLPGEREVRFEAEWTADGWRFGKRVAHG